MATLQTYTPSSLRNGSPSRGSSSGSVIETVRPYLISGRKERTAAVGRSAFIALPKEGEDARITGSTRSLDRRLLALNLQGRLPIRAAGLAMVDSRIA